MLRAGHAELDALQVVAPVSRETLDKLEAYVALLSKWQRIKNLVGPETLPQVWSRHILDSWQLTRLAPLDRIWLDIGSGAGFPGLVVAIAMRDARPGQVILVESNQRKAAFLREAVRVTGAPAEVRGERAENVVPDLAGKIGVVTARAFAALEPLCALTYPLVEKGAVALFPKGQGLEAELTEATRYWNIEADRIASVSDPAATILRIRSLRPTETSRPTP